MERMNIGTRRVSESRAGPILRRERLGGLLNSYYREAA